MLGSGRHSRAATFHMLTRTVDQRHTAISTAPILPHKTFYSRVICKVNVLQKQFEACCLK